MTQYRPMPVTMAGSPEGGHMWSTTRNSDMDLFRDAAQEEPTVPMVFSTSDFHHWLLAVGPVP